MARRVPGAMSSPLWIGTTAVHFPQRTITWDPLANLLAAERPQAAEEVLGSHPTKIARGVRSV
jgi:hypothetical protein